MIHVVSGLSLWDNTSWHTAYKWAIKNFGRDTFIACGKDWYFDSEQNATLFLLRWS